MITEDGNQQYSISVVCEIEENKVTQEEFDESSVYCQIELAGRERVQDIQSGKSKPMIVHQEHAPEWLVDNKYILYGYRVDFVRKRDLVKSLFMKHNELLNIWTHLLGGIFFVALVFYIIFYFDVFSIIFSKVGDLFSQKNLDSIKNAVPLILNHLE